jgi:hypothetical protein
MVFRHYTVPLLRGVYPDISHMILPGYATGPYSSAHRIGAAEWSTAAVTIGPNCFLFTMANLSIGLESTRTVARRAGRAPTVSHTRLRHEDHW